MNGYERLCFHSVEIEAKEVKEDRSIGRGEGARGRKPKASPTSSLPYIQGYRIVKQVLLDRFGPRSSSFGWILVEILNFEF